MGTTDARRLAWTPAARPDWVTRINQEGRYFDLDSVVPLDEASLLNAAREKTGLSDFGDHSDWYERFQVFIKSLREEADLNLMGRLMTRSDLVNILVARLEIEETYRQHPEIEDEEIVKPVMIVGQFRTGTSLLLNLLSLDQGNGSLRHWECMYPCPPPEKANYFSDPRIAKADHLVEQFNRVNPELIACHEFNALIPTEASHAMILNFDGAWLVQMGSTPSHAASMQKRDTQPSLLYQKRLLKLLQWKNPNKHWILKSPDALMYMPELLKVYPDMNFIWTHRDPLKAADSITHFLCNYLWVRSDQTKVSGGIAERMLSAEFLSSALNPAIDWLETGVIPKERVCNISFYDLEKSPVAEVEKVYRQFGMVFADETRRIVSQYMADNPRSARPQPKYQPPEVGKASAERQALKRYQDYFNVRSEY